ncbi:hypothetical protein HYH02_000322 [Chlamydomonas schloesseri]|uniref:UBX domain-containing protein n=1 Tax=Chlamydomonas schloesseri TaxID=2026947 RepID=A0A835WMK2_9CHLO|nr:hypothetical protein HYH02_000322 [Chlamydomonas schloesseri]|eukprot:KAG2450221.1 hypothetical protein HYH02_000322 [Chlamydomonas schloesseri]
MISFELNARANKLLAEQKARAEKEKARLEKERVLAERQRARELAREAEAQQRRLQQLEAEQRAKDAEFELREANRGVFLRLELAALPADEAAVAAKGVRRSKDKIILPPSAGALLMNQDASRNGAMLFEVALPAAASVPSLPTAPATTSAPSAAAATTTTSAPNTSTSASSSTTTTAGVPGRTHAGVLEFTAPEGCVLLPRKVAQSLWGRLDAVPQGSVVVTYVLLPKGDYVRLQPMSHGFHEAMGDLLKEALEAEMMTLSTLSEGDWITVNQPDDGKEWPLRVQELRPGAAVSVLDTDLAADVVPSLEAEEYLARWEEDQRRQQERLAALAAERAEQEAAEAASAARRQAEAAAAAAAAAAEREALQQRLAASLPPEPEAGASTSGGGGGGGGGGDQVFTCAFTLPDGTRVLRRFAASQPAQLLFDFVDSRGAGGWARGSYRLVTRMPRRVVEPASASAASASALASAEGGGGAGVTLAELGLGVGGGSEAFLLEALEAPRAAAGVEGADGGSSMEVCS